MVYWLNSILMILLLNQFSFKREGKDMNRILKVITLGLVVVFMVGCLAGCGSKSSFNTS